MDNDWNSFVQSKYVQTVLNTVVAVICGFYSVDAVRELMSPSDTSALLIEQIGTTGFYALTVARLLVCVWVTVTFARMAVKSLTKDDEGEE